MGQCTAVLRQLCKQEFLGTSALVHSCYCASLDASQEAARFQKRLEGLRRAKSLPSQPPKAGGIGDTAAAAGKAAREAGSGPLRSSSSSPHQVGSGPHRDSKRPAEELGGGSTGGKAARREQHQGAAVPATAAKRPLILADSSSSSEDEEEGSSRKRQQKHQQQAREAADHSPKRKAAEDMGTAPAALSSQAVAHNLERSPSSAGPQDVSMETREEERAPAVEPGPGRRQQQPERQRSLGRQASGVKEAQAHSSGRGKRPSPEPDGQGADPAPQQQQQQQQQPGERGREPSSAPSAAAGLPDLSHLPPKKRMMLMMQQSRAAASAGPSGAQSSGAVARGAVEGAGDSQGDSVRRRGGVPAGGARQPFGHGMAEDEASPIGAGVSIKTVVYKGDDPSAPEENGLPTPTSPPGPTHGLPDEPPGGKLPMPKPQSQQGAQRHQRGAAAEEEAASGRQASPAAHSSGTAGDRPQLRNMSSFTAGHTAGAAGGSHGPDRQGTSAGQLAGGNQPGGSGGGGHAPRPLHHHQQQHAHQQQECSAAVAPAPSGSAAMGSAGQGPELRDAHILINDEVGVIQEVMRLVDLTMAAGEPAQGYIAGFHVSHLL
jgi:hypothetical protein